jgi:hypothetical protein
MMNPFSEINWNPDRKERRRFATTLMIGFPVVAAVLLVTLRWRGGSWELDTPLAVAGAGVGLGLILWLVPQIARPFFVAWYAVACGAGWLIGNVALAAIYLLIVTPIGLVRRAIGKSAFSKRFDRNAPTYWRDASPRAQAERYYRQF